MSFKPSGPGYWTIKYKKHPMFSIFGGAEEHTETRKVIKDKSGVLIDCTTGLNVVASGVQWIEKIKDIVDKTEVVNINGYEFIFTQNGISYQREFLTKLNNLDPKSYAKIDAILTIMIEHHIAGYDIKTEAYLSPIAKFIGQYI